MYYKPLSCKKQNKTCAWQALKETVNEGNNYPKRLVANSVKVWRSRKVCKTQLKVDFSLSLSLSHALTFSNPEGIYSLDLHCPIKHSILMEMFLV